MPAALPERHLRRHHVSVHRPRPVPDGVRQLQRQLVVAAFRVGLLLVPVRGAVLLCAGQRHGGAGRAGVVQLHACSPVQLGHGGLAGRRELYLWGCDKRRFRRAVEGGCGVVWRL